MKTASAIAFVLGALAWFCRPLGDGWWPHQHEETHYPLRVLEYLHVLGATGGYPRWAPHFNWGFGSAFFNFYAPGVYAAAALPVAFGVEAALALKGLIALVTALAALGSFGLAYGETRRLDAAMVAAIAFALSPYRLFCWWGRGDVAETAALGLMPFSWWAARALGRVEERRLFVVAAALAASHAAVLMTHTLTGQWSSAVLLVIAAATGISAWRRGERGRVRALALGFAGAFALAAVYVVPALVERRDVQIELMTSGFFATPVHHHPWRNFLSPTWWGFVGEPILVAAAASAIACLHPRLRAHLRPSLLWWAIALALFALMPTWAREWWAFIPLGRYIQFPWRLLGEIGAAGAAAIAIAWAAILPRSIFSAVAALAISLALMFYGHAASHNRPERWLDAAKAPRLAEVETDTTSKGEYIPRWNRLGKPPGPHERVTPRGPATVVAVTPHGIAENIAAVATGPAMLDVHRFYFPGWSVRTVSGPALATMQPSPAGRILLSLPAPGRYELAVEWTTTPLRRASAWLSLLALVFFVVGIAKMRR